MLIDKTVFFCKQIGMLYYLLTLTNRIPESHVLQSPK